MPGPEGLSVLNCEKASGTAVANGTDPRLVRLSSLVHGYLHYFVRDLEDTLR